MAKKEQEYEWSARDFGNFWSQFGYKHQHYNCGSNYTGTTTQGADEPETIDTQAVVIATKRNGIWEAETVELKSSKKVLLLPQYAGEDEEQRVDWESKYWSVKFTPKLIKS